jgi:uncharacterized protein (UPF0371 family)
LSILNPNKINGIVDLTCLLNQSWNQTLHCDNVLIIKSVTMNWWMLGMTFSIT